MAKKRLSDLLREETQAPEANETNTESNADSNADESAANDSESDTEPDVHPAIATVDTTAVKVDDENDDADEADADHVKRSSRTTKAELNDMVTDLESKLDAAREAEAALNQQVQDLEADLQEQTVLVKQLKAKIEPAQQQIQALQTELKQQQQLTNQLQTELKQTQQLKDELAEAKQTILQLTEVNQNLAKTSAPAPTSVPARTLPTPPGMIVSNRAPSRAPIQRPVASSSALSTQPESVPELEDTNPARPAASQGINPQHYYHPAPKQLRRQSVVPAKSTQNSMLSDDDIGWVD